MYIQAIFTHSSHYTKQFHKGGETDWKILGIDINDPLARYVDCKSHAPKLKSLKWLRFVVKLSKMLRNIDLDLSNPTATGLQ